MKFARYLQATQVPEWKDAYIDYRGLKKQLKEIRTSSPQSRSIDELTARSSKEALWVDIEVSSALESSAKPVPTILLTPACSTPMTMSRAPSLTSVSGNFSERQCTEAEMDAVKIDAQVAKVEAFYSAQESAMHARTRNIREQGQELALHHNLWHAAKPHLPTWKSQLKSWSNIRNEKKKQGPTPIKISLPTRLGTHQSIKHKNSSNDEKGFGSSPTERKPDEYPNSKRKLKKAIFEHYRVLEMLNNYRILNLEGFRKVLKKFDKVTKSSVQATYMAEKVYPSTFASEMPLKVMIKDMEDLFTERISDGDKKQAVRRLRADSLEEGFYLSAFRSGLFLGAAIPAFGVGLWHSFHHVAVEADYKVRQGLLFAHTVLAIPVVLALLVGVNMFVWRKYRVNYAFIFAINMRTRIDAWEYLEMPSFFLATLCYTFWVSSSTTWSEYVNPIYWPLIWLGLVVSIMVAPVPLFFKNTRFWFIKSSARLLAPGFYRVEFTDFWLGDQLCSFSYTFSGLYSIGLGYAYGFDKMLTGSGHRGLDWGIPFALVSLPLFIRTVHSVRRYADSGLYSHLINGGKYVSAIFAQLLYYLLRKNGPKTKWGLGIWLTFGVFSSLYGAIWDSLMDWSLLEPRAKHFMLRSDLMYDGQTPPYYFAIISNLLLRFSWVIYIPHRGPSVPVRGFIAAILELLRRWQWNFYRVESEHLGNKDQYRVTREMPLPYRVEPEEEEEDGHDAAEIKKSWIPVLFH